MATKGQANVETTEAGYDTGTGLYTSNPAVSVDLSHETSESTGAVSGPAEPTVYVSEDHEGAPTGAASGPAGPTTYNADGTVTIETADEKAVESKAAENKSVKKAAKK